jgi:hypothetical protein
VIAGCDNDPDWIALDLLSQAEHDESAQSILITDDAAFGRAVAEAVDKRLQTLERARHRGASWRDYGAVITVRDPREAAKLSNRIAPEHLELCVADPEALARDHPCRRALPRPMDARGHRRLCRRAEPRAAHGPVGALFLGPVGHGLHEAHHAGAR